MGGLQSRLCVYQGDRFIGLLNAASNVKALVPFNGISSLTFELPANGLAATFLEKHPRRVNLAGAGRFTWAIPAQFHSSAGAGVWKEKGGITTRFGNTIRMLRPGDVEIRPGDAVRVRCTVQWNAAGPEAGDRIECSVRFFNQARQLIVEATAAVVQVADSSTVYELRGGVAAPIGAASFQVSWQGERSVISGYPVVLDNVLVEVLPGTDVHAFSYHLWYNTLGALHEAYPTLGVLNGDLPTLRAVFEKDLGQPADTATGWSPVGGSTVSLRTASKPTYAPYPTAMVVEPAAGAAVGEAVMDKAFPVAGGEAVNVSARGYGGWMYVRWILEGGDTRDDQLQFTLQGGNRPAAGGVIAPMDAVGFTFRVRSAANTLLDLYDLYISKSEARQDFFFSAEEPHLIPPLHGVRVSWEAWGTTHVLFPDPSVNWDTLFDPASLDATAAWSLVGNLDVALEVAKGRFASEWVEPPNCRFKVIEDDTDWAQPGATVKLTAVGVADDLNGVLPTDLSKFSDKKRRISGTAGALIALMLDEGHASGLATLVRRDFDPVHDSNGEEWTETLTLDVSPTVTLFQLLDSLAAQSMCDWRMEGNLLRLFKVRDYRNYYDTPSARVVFGADIVGGPTARSVADVMTKAIVIGDNHMFVNDYTVYNEGHPRGGFAVAVSQGGVSDLATMSKLAENMLAGRWLARVEDTREWSDSPLLEVHPLLDYLPGDLVAVAGDRLLSVADDKQRIVRQITVQVDDTGLVSGNVVFGSKIADQWTRLSKRVKGIAGGSTITGGSNAVSL